MDSRVLLSLSLPLHYPLQLYNLYWQEDSWARILSWCSCATWFVISRVPVVSLKCLIKLRVWRTNIQSSDVADQVWIWPNEDGATFYYDIGEIVRLRVETEEWHDQIPNGPDQAHAPALSERKPPYSIHVCECVSSPLRFPCWYVSHRVLWWWQDWDLLIGGDGNKDIELMNHEEPTAI
jgi:hypothetical protein